MDWLLASHWTEIEHRDTYTRADSNAGSEASGTTGETGGKPCCSASSAEINGRIEHIVHCTIPAVSGRVILITIVNDVVLATERNGTETT